MTTCKDCFHEEVCNAICPKMLLPYQSGDYSAELFCLQFKNKADYAEVKHGEWKTPTTIGGRAFNVPHCSVCNGIPCGVDENTKYCPYCGAKMK